MSSPNITAIDFSNKGKDGKKDDFKLTTDEAKRLEEKMKDPEFMKLWVEYAQSLADPKVREEEEAYLREVEERAKSDGDDSFDFIFPKPAYAIELLECPDAKKGHRVGINICTSDKIECFREETTGDRLGSHWFVPVSVGVARAEPKAYENADWEIYDAVFHPKTVELANRSDKFMVFLTEIAVEHINAGYKRRFDFKFRRLPTSLQCLGAQPKNQTVRRSDTKNTPTGPREVSLGPIKATFEEDDVKKRTKIVGDGATSSKNSQTSSTAAASSSSSSSRSQPQTSAKPEKNTGNIKMTVLHRGEIDLTDAWNWSKLDKRIGIPKELVLRAELPTIERATELDVDIVKGVSVEISCAAKKLHGAMLLDFTVEETPVSAKFERTKKELTLVLKVVPPPAPPSAVMQSTEETKKSATNDDDKSEVDEETGKADENGKMKSAANKQPSAEQLEQKSEKVKQAFERLQQQQQQQQLPEAVTKQLQQEDEQKAARELAKQKQQQEEQEKMLRARQDAWLKEEDERKQKSQKELEEKERRRKQKQDEEEEQRKTELLKQQQQKQKEQEQKQSKKEIPAPVGAAVSASNVDSTSNLLLIDDDDDEFKPKKSESETKKEEAVLREAAKKSADAQKQEEVMHAELEKKMRQLPLTNGFIFSID